MWNAQVTVEEFLRKHDLARPPAERLLDLTSEVGEVAKEVLKATGYGERAFAPPEAWAEELGDLLYCVLALAAETGVDAERALAGALDKMERRLAAAGTPGSGG